MTTTDQINLNMTKTGCYCAKFSLDWTSKECHCCITHYCSTNCPFVENILWNRSTSLAAFKYCQRTSSMHWSVPLIECVSAKVFSLCSILSNFNCPDQYHRKIGRGHIFKIKKFNKKSCIQKTLNPLCILIVAPRQKIRYKT